METKINFIALAIPFFFLLIGVELWVAQRKKRAVYRLNDALNDLSCGIISQVWAVWAGLALFGVYVWFFDSYRLYTFAEGSVWPWLIAFVLVDFLYYWWHRLSHEVNLLWAAHIVHHQSEDYNLAVALRQAILTSVTSLPFYLPMAFLGIRPIIYAAIVSFSTLYQFWIHTQLVGKLGWLESFLNTPSHHRVHHAINPRYLDKNYGATLIIWDRLFGTFIEEKEAPVYGLVRPLKSFDPLWAQFHYWFDMAYDAWRAPHFSDKLAIWFKSPAWHPRGLDYPAAKEVSPKTYTKYDASTTKGRAIYIFSHFVVLTLATTAFIFFGAQLRWHWKIFFGGVIVLSLWAWGGFFEGKRWALPIEATRLALAVGSLFLWPW